MLSVTEIFDNRDFRQLTGALAKKIILGARRSPTPWDERDLDPAPFLTRVLTRVLR
jgi:hypothetical protein